MIPADTIAEVMLDDALDKALDYRIPASLQGKVFVGSRVKIPVRNSVRQGVVVGTKRESPFARLLEIAEILSDLILVETCDGTDNDCDTFIDEGTGNRRGDLGTCGKLHSSIKFMWVLRGTHTDAYCAKAGAGAHASTESVGLCTTTVVRLEGTLAHW